MDAKVQSQNQLRQILHACSQACLSVVYDEQISVYLSTSKSRCGVVTDATSRIGLLARGGIPQGVFPQGVLPQGVPSIYQNRGTDEMTSDLSTIG